MIRCNLHNILCVCELKVQKRRADKNPPTKHCCFSWKAHYSSITHGALFFDT
jgi:hypothetical protein